MAVDTHVFRVSQPHRPRVRARRRRRSKLELEKVIPAQFLRHAHHWLILHGRYVCVARKPKCEACVIADLCKWPEKTNAIPAPLVRLPDQVLP